LFCVVVVFIDGVPREGCACGEAETERRARRRREREREEGGEKERSRQARRELERAARAVRFRNACKGNARLKRATALLSPPQPARHTPRRPGCLTGCVESTQRGLLASWTTKMASARVPPPSLADDSAALAGSLRLVDLADVAGASIDACLATLEGLSAEVGRGRDEAER
jgi:hypothetical protein